MRKKLFTLVLAAVMAGSLCACNAKDDVIGPGTAHDEAPDVPDSVIDTFLKEMSLQERYEDAMARVSAKDSMHLYYKISTEGSSGTDDGIVDLELLADVAGLQDGTPVFDGTMSMSLDGDVQSVAMCYVDGTLYIDSDGEKVKYAVPSEEAFSMISAYMPPLFDVSVLSDFEIESQDQGRVWIGFSLSEKAITDMLQELFGVTLDLYPVVPLVSNAKGHAVIAFSDGDALGFDVGFDVQFPDETTPQHITVTTAYLDTMAGYTADSVKAPADSSSYRDLDMQDTSESENGADSGSTMQLP